MKDGELALARQLIEQSAVEEFQPEKYHDTVRERVLEAIQRKVDGQEITAEPSEAPQTKIIDLMDALKASLAKRGHEHRGEEARTAGGAEVREGAGGPAEKEGQRGALATPETLLPT